MIRNWKAPHMELWGDLMGAERLRAAGLRPYPTWRRYGLPKRGPR
jgi:hypothetical protein